mgnify:FL=1
MTEVTILLLAMLFAFTTIVIIYRVEYQKRKVNPKKFDKEKARQELVVLKNTVAYLDRQVILGNITREQYQQEMAVVDFKVKELEKELLHGYAKEWSNG